MAGFRPDDIEIVAQRKLLTITGKRAEESDDTRYLHRGIAARPFERHFQLADFVELRSADFENGLLSMVLQCVVPRAMKPRKIAIGAVGCEPRLEPPGVREAA